ncbi:MAG TPA: hypothetical protein VM733_01150 [Thermoanaerobaculia bacterium]|nr:hypothetical protein [Thermoanaerobaculia bacterium]
MIYRKQGHTERWENGTLIRVSESGAAREEGEFFECWPGQSASRRVVESSSIEDVVAAVAKIECERLILMRGAAHHEYGEQTWREETDRLHASIVHGSFRALVDSTTRRLDDLFLVASALHRIEGEREAPQHLRIAPNVSAAVLPFLKDAKQTTGGVDGYGNPITGTSASFYRPSYRVRPVRMLFNVALEHEQTHIDDDLPRAVALLAPATGIELRVLIEDKARVYASSIRVEKIAAVATERIWYPYGAGSFGAEMML